MLVWLRDVVAPWLAKDYNYAKVLACVLATFVVMYFLGVSPQDLVAWLSSFFRS